MEITTIIFYCFALVLVLAALKVITAKNPVHAALFLVLSFFTAAAIWMLLKAEFLAITLVLVYVGAVMVLFLFVVMMLDIDPTKMREGWVRYLPVGLIVAVAMLVQMLILIGVKGRAVNPFPADNAAAIAADSSNITWLARTLFTEYLLPFEFAAVILTVAVVAAVMLTLRRRTGVKSQNPGEQTMVKADQRLRMVKMEAEQPVVHSNNTPAAGEEETKA